MDRDVIVALIIIAVCFFVAISCAEDKPLELLYEALPIRSPIAVPLAVKAMTQYVCFCFLVCLFKPQGCFGNNSRYRWRRLPSHAGEFANAKQLVGNGRF